MKIIEDKKIKLNLLEYLIKNKFIIICVSDYYKTRILIEKYKIKVNDYIYFGNDLLFYINKNKINYLELDKIEKNIFLSNNIKYISSNQIESLLNEN